MSTETLKKEALELPEQQRAQLACFLIDSLSPAPEFESKEAFGKELKKRIRLYEEGKSETTPWHEVKSQASTELRGNI
jgi:putative addiction module component (TIGR02574 family)